MNSVEIRAKLGDALRLDLVGPDNGTPLEGEVLPQAPSRWYLTGFLVPLEADESQRSDETATENIDVVSDSGGADDAQTPEAVTAKRAFFPSSMGMSLLIAPEATKADVTVQWGDYEPRDEKPGEGAAEGLVREDGSAYAEELDGPSPDSAVAEPGATYGGEGKPRRRLTLWYRLPRTTSVTVQFPESTTRPQEYDVPDSMGLKLVVSVRPVSMNSAGMLPKGTRSVSIFLVNRRTPAPYETCDTAFVFQATLTVKVEQPLVPRPNLRGLDADDWDEQVADLQFRDVYEYAVGHGIATNAVLEPDGHCHEVSTCWIPSAEVERVAPSPIKDVELSMEALAQLADGSEAQQRLGALVTSYREWISQQQVVIPSGPSQRAQTGKQLLDRAEIAAKRIEAGILLLKDPQALEAFKIANRTMAAAARRRFGVMQGKDPASVSPPAWRPFQLAFVLMNLEGIAAPTHLDREIVDLLFFPTGGGKTEAYLGLAAFTLVLRRLRNPGIASAGLSVLMRYTLRLLTLDQLSRAATLMCALELERQKDTERLGTWPFEIGLWVGRAATPNRMGCKGDKDSETARAKTIAYKNDDRRPSPIPLEECPWCGTKFTRNSFQLVPNNDAPTDLRVLCVNRGCDFTRDRPLPILAVDDPIYRRLPCFMIATVDKFAAMPWTGEVGMFFGGAERHDKNGFYGPCTQGVGQGLEKPLLPPDLIIQDELHLISGPLGTLVGLYETALDELCARPMGDKSVRPKIVASTATVRRAEKQIQALFNRRVVEVFPPPGLDRRDSYFARTLSSQESNARLYVGVAAQGRSPKVVLLRTYLALLGAAQKAYKAAGGHRNKDNPADPYMTLLGYFNSLRELGGSRRIIEDEVSTRLTGYAKHKRVGEQDGLFDDRKIAYEVVELTSRVSTDKVADAKRKLARRFYEDDRVDVAIATNMISVGLDIVRLGLMVVLGQPKTSAEYIQATSRVGRDQERPGLVVTLLNIHRPRDRSHYERFTAYHESFYRSVEATSVTPFSPRAMDRGLAGTAVALARLGYSVMTPPKGAGAIQTERGRLDAVVEAIAGRAASHTPMKKAEADAIRQRVKDRVNDLLDTWSQIAHDYGNQGVQLQYQREMGAAQRLLYEFLSPELSALHPRHKKFRANRSMRDVEPSVNLWLKTLDDVDVETEDV
ncbi:MAG: DISARM system helicase DrmA [Candidatus Hydrogenedentales bacterium]|jgi:hypothetical protein